MTTSYTSLLGLALPQTGDLSGTWGVTVNDSITKLVEDSVANYATASVTSGNWTLTTTGSGVSNEARMMILIPTGTPGVSRNIIAPSHSKMYVVVNQSDASVVLKGAATTGATITAGYTTVVVWNGSDFEELSPTLSRYTLDIIGGVIGSVPYQNATNDTVFLSPGTDGKVLTTHSTGLAPTWDYPSVSNASGTLPIAHGGTGLTSTPSNGQLLIGNGTGYTAATLTAGSNVTITNSSGGITIAASGGGGGSGTVTSVGMTVPSFLSVSGSPVTTSGTLAVTLATTPSNGQLLIGNGTGYSTANLTAGSGINITNSSGGITIAATGGTGTVTSVGVSVPSGLSVSGSPVTTSGTIAITTSLSGVLKGTGSGFTAATAGTDYVSPSTASTFTALQTFTGSTTNLASVLTNAAEPITVSATAATGTINFDVTTQSIIYYTANATGNWTLNVRGSASASLNSVMSVGQSLTLVFMSTNGATAYYQSALTIDGVASTPKWQGGSAPIAGDANSVDVYVVTVIKTGAATFSTFASQTKFA